MNALIEYPEVLTAAASYLPKEDSLANLCIQIQQIASPTGEEKARSDWVATYFNELGLADVYQDELHNTYGRIPGRTTERTTNAPALMISAHIDTVFPFETDLTVRIDEASGLIYGPGIGDNSTGVAALLSAAEALSKLAAPPVDIWFVANSGEEGLGDLRGMRAAVERLATTGNDRIGACIIIEGTGVGRIVHQALGSRRYLISASAPGGHSWSDFGSASAIHALVQLAAKLGEMSVPRSPRTTFNIGRIQGGTSVNTIAQAASLELDLRSEDPEALAAIIQQTLQIVSSFQSAAWQKKNVKIDVECIGDRPTGEIGLEHPLVVAAGEALTYCGVPVQRSLSMSSTDANIPLSRGIPAVCVGIAQGGDAHRLSEWMNPALLPRGVQHLILLAWWSTLWIAGELNE